MVLSVARQPDDSMLEVAREFMLDKSQLLEADAFGPGTSVWACDTCVASSRGFWVGHHKSDGSVELYAYLALVSISLGGRQAMEAKKAWTDPQWRRRGMGRALLLKAAQSTPLVSDSDGMSDDAFAQWDSPMGLTKRWWDTHARLFVEEARVPQEHRHTAYAQGSRWQIVLEQT